MGPAAPDYHRSRGALPGRRRRLPAATTAGGDDEYDKAIPGGTTGLLCKMFVGKKAHRPVYKVDTATLGQLLALEKQAAEELGQWSEKHAVTVKDELAERLRAARERKAAREKAGA